MKKTHGMSSRGHRDPLYIVWFNMLQRCNNPKNTSYIHYGGRGIRVCQRWFKFENFLADMGLRPAGHSIERKDFNKGYNLRNCTWATSKEQTRNYRRNV